MHTLLRFQWPTGLRWLLLGALTLTPAAAQYPVNLQVASDGRLLDANPQLGGSRYYDYSRPQSPLMAGNLLTTGNVRGGLSFQGYSPIADPRSFRAGLPSGGLSSFIRDSVSVADSQTPLGGLARQPFFDPVYTAPTTGSLQGQFAPQALRPTVPNLAGSYPGIDARQSTGPLGAEITGAWPGLQVAGPLDPLDLSDRQGILRSRLFGVDEVRLPGERPGPRAARPEVRDLGDQLRGLGPERPDPRAILKDELEHKDRPAEPALSSRLRVTPQPFGSRLDDVLGAAAAT
ncbi:MAG: hypothetical protein HUU27_08870, partial [Phycisphaerae bacterium]|nr:hypothetical protein [Phycisphaerae bacterium]